MYVNRNVEILQAIINKVFSFNDTIGIPFGHVKLQNL